MQVLDQERTMWVNSIVALIGAPAAKKRFALPAAAARMSAEELHQIAAELLDEVCPYEAPDRTQYGREDGDFESYLGNVYREAVETPYSWAAADEEDPDYIPGF